MRKDSDHRFKRMPFASKGGAFIFFVTLIAAFTYVLVPVFIDPSRAETRELVIETSDGTEISYQVEIADSADEKSLGLMHREYMADDHGMIFLEEWGRPEIVSMWMRDTYIPLDMLFVDESGVIVYIHENAVPMDETSIVSPVPVVAVLELNGGQASKQGIAIGDRVKNLKSFWKRKKALE